MSPHASQDGGAFVAIVGPSGAGKDSVIAYARDRLMAAGARLQFPTRWITRPPGAGEEHLPLNDAEFEEAEADGAFALTWRAHGLAYGIPLGVDAHIASGGVAVVNVSRGVLAALAARYERMFAVSLTVPEAVRVARLTAHGREQSEAVASRIARPDPAPDHSYDLDIVNDGALEAAGDRLVAFIEDVVLPR